MAPPHVTKAQHRVLAKAAARAGGVMIAGGFGGAPDPALWREPDFDRRGHVERLVGRGLLRPSDAFNSYVPTDAGRALLARRRARAQPSASADARPRGRGAAAAAPPLPLEA